MPNPIPPILAPYLQSSARESAFSLVTSLLESPANWLLLRFIVASLYGVDEFESTNVERSIGASSTGNPVVFVSFIRSYEFWQELGKKIGLNFTSLLNQNRIAYVDGLTLGLNVGRPAGDSNNISKPKSHALRDIQSAIMAARSSLQQNDVHKDRCMLVIDGLDYVLASRLDVSVAQLSSFLRTLQDEYSSLVLTASADMSLLHNIEAGATPLETEHSILIRTVAHRSDWVFQLRQLETGHAKDVSGVIQISKGGVNEIDDSALHEGEWLYQVKGDGNVNVWNRGE